MIDLIIGGIALVLYVAPGALLIVCGLVNG